MRRHFLIALAFAAISLAAVHLAIFVWLTAFVYHDDIRGYVPAGISGMFYLFVAWLLLQIPLVLAGRRRRQMSHYLAGGCLGAPIAILLSMIYCSALLTLLGYSLQKDINIAALGAVLFLTASITVYRFYMSRRADNNLAEP